MSDALLAGWPVVFECPVTWGDMDAFGHVNNTVYFRYFEHARIAYFDRVGFGKYMQTQGVGPILARTSCVFRKALTHPDRVRIGTRVRIEDMGDDRFTMLYRVVSEVHGAVAAEGEGRIIVLNYRNQTKVALPEDVRAAMIQLEEPGGD